MRKLHIRPVPGRKVRVPYTRSFLPEGGARMPHEQYWLRRLQEGDVELVPEPAPEPVLPDVPKADAVEIREGARQLENDVPPKSKKRSKVKEK